MLISLIFIYTILNLNKHIAYCSDDIYQSSYDNIETTYITGTIFNLTSSQLSECTILVNWKFATYPLSDGSYTLYNMLPVITKIHGAFRVLASRYTPHFGREGKSWDRIAHQPIGSYIDNSNQSFLKYFRLDMSSISTLLLLFFAIYCATYTPLIVTKRRLYATLYNIEWLSKKTGQDWNSVSKITKQYFEDNLSNPNPIYEESNRIDWGTVNRLESYNDDMITPFMSEILRTVRST